MDRPATVVYCGVSLDGFLARKDGTIDWLSDPTSAPSDDDLGWSEFIVTVDAMLMGRKTFEVLLGFGT
jgi:dihydrofolate reductase